MNGDTASDVVINCGDFFTGVEYNEWLSFMRLIPQDLTTLRLL